MNLKKFAQVYLKNAPAKSKEKKVAKQDNQNKQRISDNDDN